MVQGRQQIAVVAKDRGEILEQGERTPISPDEADEVFVEIQCDDCREAGTYRGDIVAEGHKQLRSTFEANCNRCGNRLEAVVELQRDTSAGGLNVVGFEPPKGGRYNHDPYFANKIEGVGEEGARTGPPR